MPSIRIPESIGTVSKVSITSAQLSASRVNIGGQQYVNSSPLTLSTATIGVNGVDATVQNWKLYYVYAVVSNNVARLIASTSSSGPSGFSAYRLVGYFDTDGSAQIISAASTLQGAVGDYKSAHMTEAQFQAQNGPGWILANGRNVAGSTWATISGSSTVPDARAVVLRGKDNARGLNPDGDYALGTYQGDQVVSHAHSINTYGNAPAITGNIATSGDVFRNSAGATNAAGGNETRMKNMTVNHFFKVN